MHVSIQIDDAAPDAVAVTSSSEQPSAAPDSAPAEVLTRAAAIGAQSAGAAPAGPGSGPASSDPTMADDRATGPGTDAGEAHSAGPAAPMGGD